MKLRKCEICGKPTAEADFSKSYKNRCKPCVAELTRERRTEQKEQTAPASTITTQATTTSLPNWEQRRYEISKEIYTRLLSHNDGDVRHYAYGHLKSTAAECVMEADTLIAELRKGEKQ